MRLPSKKQNTLMGWAAGPQEVFQARIAWQHLHGESEEDAAPSSHGEWLKQRPTMPSCWGSRET